MLNEYAARYAADVIERLGDGDAVGRVSVVRQLTAIAEGRFRVVPSDSSDVATEEARRQLATIYCLLARADPTCADYRGAVLQSIEYIERHCKWLRDYTL